MNSLRRGYIKQAYRECLPASSGRYCLEIKHYVYNWKTYLITVFVWFIIVYLLLLYFTAMRKWEQEVPPSLRAQHHHDRNLLSCRQSSTYANGPQLVVPGEIPISNGVSFDYSNFLTKPSVINKTPRDFNWTSNLGTLKTALVPTTNYKNR